MRLIFMILHVYKRMDVLYQPTDNEGSSQVPVSDAQIDNQDNLLVIQSKSCERNGSNHCSSKMSQDSRDLEYSKLKSLLQAPGKASMASVSLPHTHLNLTSSRWSTEAVPSRGQDHKRRITNLNENGGVNYKHSDTNDDDAAVIEQMFPLDLSCKNSQRTSSVQDEKPHSNMQVSGQRGDAVQNGESADADGSQRRPLNLPGRVTEVLPPPASQSQNEEWGSAPPRDDSSFDPLFILSQVACEKLNELQSAQPDKKTSGKGKNKAKKSKKAQNKGTVRKAKKKEKGHGKSKDLSQDKITSEVVENGKLIPEKPTPNFVVNHHGQSFLNMFENQSNKQNGYPDNHAEFQSQALVTNTSTVSPKMLQEHYLAHSNSGTGSIQSSDYLELSQMQRKVDTVDGSTQVEGDVDKASWPFTCHTCNTRFKNAAFLKIHEKCAHENKMARTDPTGNHIRFVSKDSSGNSQHASVGNGTPNPFPIEWKNPTLDGHHVDGQHNQPGYTAIPCILKVHRQTSTSEMSSSLVKIDGTDVVHDSSIQGSKDQFQYKLEPDLTGRHPSEILKEESTENGGDLNRQRPKLEVDGSAYEIIKVEREKSAAENVAPVTSTKGFQHKFYLQICDRNQSGEGIDSTVKIESGPDGKDVRSGLKKKIMESNPNQIRVPTSLALKFIPGDSSDPQRQPGYQHKVYLRIVDGSDSSIRIKTGSVNSQSSMGSTAVKIESMYETPRHHHVNDASRPHKCHYCPKHFPSISALTAHERIHTGEKPYECRFCGRAFYHQNDRRKHERIHTGEKPYQCSICGQKFTNKGQVKIHERNHTGERPYQCRHCHKCFKSISNVNRHEKIHTGLKPYTCPVCHRGFSRREHVRTHEEICRKKMLEEDEELADDPIGDVKLPYYRKIAIGPDDVEGEPSFTDHEPLQKKTRLESETASSYYPDGEHWSVKQANEVDDYRKHVDRENLSSNEQSEPTNDRGVGEKMSPIVHIGSSPEKVSPLLYNSGPPVKPEAVSSSGGHLEKPLVIDEGIGDSEEPKETGAGIPSEEKQVVDLDALGYSAEQIAGSTDAKSVPPNHDSKHMGENPHAEVPPENNLVTSTSQIPGVVGNTKSPPVLYVAGSGNNSSADGRYPSEKRSLVLLSVPKGGKPPPMIKKSKPVSDKLSAHIESLEPSLEQPVVTNASDPAKKEPRLYICGSQTKPAAPIIQKGISQEVIKPMKLSESIPESDRLKGPASWSSAHQGVPVEVMYLSSQNKEPAVIPLTTLPSTSLAGEESPPVLYLPGCHDGKPKMVALDEPPTLSGPHINMEPPKIAESPVNTMPPMLERSITSDGGRPIITIEN